MTLMEDNLNGRQSQYKMTKMEEELNLKITLMEDKFIGGQPQIISMSNMTCLYCLM